jgi:catechol 2,3-dioxygenase-like lactoylglutathione lyase family enzyme
VGFCSFEIANPIASFCCNGDLHLRSELLFVFHTDAMEDLIFILFVKDQRRSRDFYAAVIGSSPALDVPGMTEFQLLPAVRLGLMPEQGIAKLLSPVCPHPEKAQGVPRCEIYLRVADPDVWLLRAIEAGAKPVRNLELMDWHEHVAYVADPDGHVIAFAKRA